MGYFLLRIVKEFFKKRKIWGKVIDKRLIEEEKFFKRGLWVINEIYIFVLKLYNFFGFKVREYFFIFFDNLDEVFFSIENSYLFGDSVLGRRRK